MTSLTYRALRVLTHAALFTFALVVATPLAFADDPRLDYHTITTPHFFVHYHDGLEDFAEKVAVAAEEAHIILSPLLDWVPAERTHVYCNDKVDTANGSATVFGRNHINVFAMAPEADSVLGFSDDWIRVLVFHEYVHILHLDTIRGLPPLVNMLVGQQWAPNNTLPRWYTEGLATFYESARTRGGRVKGALFRTYIRTDILDDKFFDLGATSNFPIIWPGGSLAYIYGSFFLDYVTRQHGEEYVRGFNHRYGTRVIPWGINTISKDLSGQTMEELYAEWHAFEAGRAFGDRAAVIATGATPVERVTSGRGGTSGWPINRPGTNETWFYHFDHYEASTYSSTFAGRPPERRVEVESGASKAAFTPDGETLIYSQSRILRGTYRYLDLYAYHLPTGGVRRLTHGERAREPAVSPDGRRIAYVRNRSGTMELVIRPYPHVSGPERVLVSGLPREGDETTRWQQISMPAFSPDGTKIAFSYWRQRDGKRDIWSYDLEAEPALALRRLTNDVAYDVDPHWADDGLIYFSSDRTGIFNVFSLDPDDGDVRQLSNVVTGLFQPRRSANGRWIYATQYTSLGFEIARFRRPVVAERAEPSRREEIEQVDYPDVDTSTFERGPYQPIRWLAPLLLQPQLGIVTSGGGLGGSVQGWDPIRRHQWSLSAGYTTGRELSDRGATASFAYSYDRLPVALSASGLFRDYPQERQLFVQSEYLPFMERQYLGRLRLSYPFRGLTDTLSVSARFDVDYTQFQSVPSIQHDPADLEPSYPTHGWFNEVAVSLGYSNRETYPQTVSTASGWAAGIGLEAQHPAIGSEEHVVTFTHQADLSLQNPLAPLHVLTLSGQGALTVSEDVDPRSYALGGVRPQDVLTSAVFQSPRRDLVVRGYPPGVLTGTRYQLLNAEYRFPIVNFDSGFSTVPVYFRRLKGAAFVDSGTAFDGFLGDADFITGAGAELILETVFAYYAFGNFTVGLARGLDDEGITDFYFLFGGGF